MRPGCWLLPAVLASLVLCVTVWAQTQVSAEEFASRLDRAASLADLGTAAPSSPRMAQVRDALGLPVEVTAASWRLSVPKDPLLESLSGTSSSDFDEASSHIRSLQQALEDALSRRVPRQNEVHDALQRAYAGLVVEQPSLVDRVLRAIIDLIEALVYALLHFVGAGSILVWATLLGLLAVAIIVLRRMRLVPEWVGPPATGRGAPMGAVDWAARADEALRAGDRREAVRNWYLALLATLAKGGVLADVPALTAGEARVAVQRTSPAIYPSVEAATGSYERVAYGGSAPSEADVQALREAVARARAR